MQQQQALAVQRHLHRPAPDAAALGQADQRGEKGQRGERAGATAGPPGGLRPWAPPPPTPSPSSSSSSSEHPPSPQVTLPVYLNFTRADLIFTVDFEIATKEDPRSFYERGVAVLCTE